MLVLLTASDVKLEERVLAKLQAERSTVHAHINDEMALRAEREGAKARASVSEHSETAPVDHDPLDHARPCLARTRPNLTQAIPIPIPRPPRSAPSSPRPTPS